MSPNTAAADKDKPQKMRSVVEFEPPLACVRRILKHTLPSSTNVGKDASAAFARACGIFIIYVTACANDFARENKRQTITANDVLAAIKELDFDDFSPDMLAFLESYRATEKSKKDAKAKAAAQKEEDEKAEQDSPNKADEDDDEDDEDDDEEEEEATGTKRSREDDEGENKEAADEVGSLEAKRLKFDESSDKQEGKPQTEEGSGDAADGGEDAGD